MALATGAHQNQIDFLRKSITPIDPHWDSVVVLMGFDDKDDNDAAATDEGPIQNTLTVNGTGAKIDDGQSKFGGKSLEITSNSSVSIPDQTGTSIANSDDKTFEAFFRTTSVATLQSVMNKRKSSGADEFAMFLNASKIQVNINRNGSNLFALIGTTTLVNNQWYHYAFTREGTTYRMFLDGNLEASNVEALIPSGATEPLHIGKSRFNTGRWMRGNIDEVRITTGVARYTESFTAPTRKFPRRG